MLSVLVEVRGLSCWGMYGAEIQSYSTYDCGLYLKETLLWCLAWFLAGLVHILIWNGSTWLRRSKLEMFISLWGPSALSLSREGIRLCPLGFILVFFGVRGGHLP